MIRCLKCRLWRWACRKPRACSKSSRSSLSRPRRRAGRPRLRRPERHQPGWQVVAIDDLVAPDHPVRAVWAFATALDLRELHEAVKAREGVPGRTPPAPELMMALWLWGDGRRGRQRPPARQAVRGASGLSLAVRRGLDEPPHTVRFPGGACHSLGAAIGHRRGGAGRRRSGGARRAGAGRASRARRGGGGFASPAPAAGGDPGGGGNRRQDAPALFRSGAGQLAAAHR